MVSVLMRAFSFMLIIVIGYVLKEYKVVDENMGFSMKKVLINVTLPCAIITNFAKIESASGVMVLIMFLGILTNIVMLGLAVLYTRKKTPQEQALYMMSMPSYNIGAFALPYVQSFLPALGVVTACMFDVGNSIMCTGGTYSFTAEYTAKGESQSKLDVLAIGKRLLTSPPLMTYVIMFLLTLVHFQVPETFLTLISPLASANTFVAMLMIGLLFHLELKKEYFREIIRILFFRNVFAIVLTSMVYFLLPFDLVIRQALAVISFAPISAVAPAYVGMCGGDEGKASAVNSISILWSMLSITVLLIVLGLS